MKAVFLMSAVAVLFSASLASATIRCTTHGNITRCTDSKEGTTTRCVDYGTVVRCN